MFCPFAVTNIHLRNDNVYSYLFSYITELNVCIFYIYHDFNLYAFPMV